WVIASLFTTQMTRSTTSGEGSIWSREVRIGADAGGDGLGASAAVGALGVLPISGTQLGIAIEQPAVARDRRARSPTPRPVTGASPGASRERRAPRARARSESALPPCTPSSTRGLLGWPRSP